MIEPILKVDNIVVEDKLLKNLNIDKVDVGHDDSKSPKLSNVPKRVVLKELDFPSQIQTKYRCKVVGRKKHKKRYFYKIKPSSNLVRVEMISELSATPFPAPTLLSTVIPPKTLVPVELKFGSKRGLVGVVPEQRVLGENRTVM